jgi:hypothetical protein
MGNDEHRFFAPVDSSAEEVRAGRTMPSSPPGVRGVAGQLRPYRDVRAGFEPWRRVALLAWSQREDPRILH